MFSLRDCLLVLFIYRSDENVAGVYDEGEYFEQQEPEHFVEQGKLFAELAFTYLYFDYMQYSKVVIMIFTKPFYKGYENYFATLCRNVEYILKTIGWKNLVYSKLLLKYLVEFDMPNCRYGSGEMMNGDVYEKCTLCPSTYVDQPIICATTSTQIWERA